MSLLNQLSYFFPIKKDNSLSRYYYKQQIDSYSSSLAVYDELTYQIAKRDKSYILSPLLIKSFIPFNSTKKEIMTCYGKTMYVRKNKIDEKIVILLYKLKIANEHVKCEFHLYDDKLFYMKYIFSFIDDAVKDSIIDTLKEKYKISNTFDFQSDVLVDSLGNNLYIDENCHFNIEYLSVNNPFLQNYSDLKEGYVEIIENNKKEFLKKIRRSL